MMNVQKVIFPGIIAGCLFLVLFASLIASPKPALADNAGEQARSAQSNRQQVNQRQAAAKTTGKKNAGTAGCPVSGAYPDSIRQWCSFIGQYANENGVDPNLIAAVMLQESGGNPDAYSKSGAVGLLQVMPRDGLAADFMCPSGPCFAARPSIQDLANPEYNISYGSQMLADLIQKYGDVREALRAYGPMDVGYEYADIILSIFQRYQ